MTEMIFDVAVVGGAFSGATTAWLIRRRFPAARVLVIEKTEHFDRKVGESTTEVSSCFLMRVLGLTQHLGHEQITKQGLRFWFTKTGEEELPECVEVGARYNSRLPGFQVDRAVLDGHVLDCAQNAGCEVWRPAKVVRVSPNGMGANELEVEMAGERKLVRAKWLVDATGRVAMLARQLGHFRRNDAHPINSIWGRFRGVADWDGAELRAKFPQWAEAAWTARSWATNHLMGYGWWCWIIPLKGGDTSIGLVYDSRLYQPPSGGTIAERIKAHVSLHPVGREMLSGATLVGNDQRAFSSLAYHSTQVAGDGWICVGDAASFIDPFYSSGLDFCGFTASGAAALISRSLAGEDVTMGVKQYDERFQYCYQAWFESIYEGKYYYLGDAELMAAAFLLDIASYHLGPVRQVFSDPACMFEVFPFDGTPGRVVHTIMSFYNRRLAHLAQRKRAAGVYGARNAGWRLLVGGFLPDASAGKLLFRGLKLWAKAEWRNLFLVPAPTDELVKETVPAR